MNHTTTLSALENNVTELTGRAVLDDAYKPALQNALAALDRARADLAERRAFDDARASEMAEANARRAAKERDQRMAANAALQQADQAYRDAGLACALAFRKVLTQAARNERVPGASVEHTLGPDIPHLNEWGFRGFPFNTGQQMAQAPMAWENTLAAKAAKDKAE